MITILDLYCGGGGASVGYVNAGFRVIGVDIISQSEYPYSFIRADALQMLNDLILFKNTVYDYGFNAIHASPPCQYYSYATTQWKNLGKEYPDLIGKTRELLLATGLPFIIENVVSAPLRKDLVLCGQMFNLNVRRHRVFEIHGFTVPQIKHEKHIGKVGDGKIISVFGHGGGKRYNHCSSNIEVWKEAMGIDWINKRKTLVESIPPAYTEYIGKHLYEQIKNKRL